MQLGRYQVSTLRPPPIHGVSFSHDAKLFAIAAENGYEVWKAYPLGLLRRRVLPGTLARVVPLPNSPLLVLQGGGANPLFPPNKAVIYHDARGAPVAELEFGWTLCFVSADISERIRGVAVRYRTVVIVLLRRVLAYEYGQTKGIFWLTKLGEWETAENEHGLTALATAPGSTLLALPGRQAGHVQLVHLPPCASPNPSQHAQQAPPSFRSPILLAHTHPLSALSASANGAHLLTASERGTLVRIWDVTRGALEGELRRGVDRAEIWGLLFEDSVFSPPPPSDPDKRREIARRKGGRAVGWSDKGTIHIWDASVEAPRNTKQQQITSVLARAGKAFSLPNYFSSTSSVAQYYLPRKNPHAFSSAIGAAADAAGIPSMRINEDAERASDEEAERFVVAWIEVEVDDDDEPEAPVAFRPGMGGMADTPRSMTPRATGTPTPTSGSRRQSITSIPPAPSPAPQKPIPPRARRKQSTDSQSTATTTATRRDSGRRGTPTSGRGSASGSTATIRAVGSGKKKKERQLVVVSHSGDWYRLRLPRVREGDEERDTKCQLVEYRRLGVGGGGW